MPEKLFETEEEEPEPAKTTTHDQHLMIEEEQEEGGLEPAKTTTHDQHLMIEEEQEDEEQRQLSPEDEEEEVKH